MKSYGVELSSNGICPHEISWKLIHRFKCWLDQIRLCCSCYWNLTNSYISHNITIECKKQKNTTFGSPLMVCNIHIGFHEIWSNGLGIGVEGGTQTYRQHWDHLFLWEGKQITAQMFLIVRKLQGNEQDYEFNYKLTDGFPSLLYHARSESPST